jgi:iron-sulfur cluster repair protein YtfE (RIC family)
MMEIEGAVAVAVPTPVAAPVPEKPNLVRGYAESGTLRVSYSIPREHVAHKDVLDIMLRAVAGLLRLGAQYESCGVAVGAQLTAMLDDIESHLPVGYEAME